VKERMGRVRQTGSGSYSKNDRSLKGTRR
jgi:hypothetical protein